MTNEEYTRWLVDNAFLKVMTSEMDYFDAKFIDPLVDKICEHNTKFKRTEMKDCKLDLQTAIEEIEICKDSIDMRVLAAYGWDTTSIKRYIVKYMPEETRKDLKKALDGENEL